jgi:hypothetical protein
VPGHYLDFSICFLLTVARFQFLKMIKFLMVSMAIVSALASQTCMFHRYSAGDSVDREIPFIVEQVESTKISPDELVREHGKVFVQVANPTYIQVAEGSQEEVQPLADFIAGLPWASDDNRTFVFQDLHLEQNLLQEYHSENPNSSVPVLSTAAQATPTGLADVFEDAQQILSIGGSGAGLGFHRPPGAQWLKVLHGEKLWLVYPPGTMPHALHGSKQVNGRPELSEVQKLPEDQRPMQCVQKAGETVYLPPGYCTSSVL